MLLILQKYFEMCLCCAVSVCAAVLHLHAIPYQWRGGDTRNQVDPTAPNAKQMDFFLTCKF